MSLFLRILLLLGSLFTVIFVVRKIRKAQMQIEDTMFWLLFPFMLVLLSIFPQVGVWASRIAGVESPVNIVFLCVIFILVIKLFLLSVSLSRKDSQIKTLVQIQALLEKRVRDLETGDAIHNK